LQPSCLPPGIAEHADFETGARLRFAKIPR